MSQTQIICPHCKTRIDLSDLARHEYEEERQKNEIKLLDDFKKREEEIQKDYREKAIKWAEQKVEESKKSQEAEKLDLTNQLQEMKKKQEESIKQEMELRKSKRELEEKAQKMELENLRKLDEERLKLQKEMQESQNKLLDEKMLTIQEENRRQLQEKDKQMEILKKSLEEANRKANQWSQQIQGEIQENALKETLRRTFATDTIDDVPTGIKGADLVQTVRTGSGNVAGVILWESKNTKAFSDAWIKKLKDDRILAKADVCILASSVLPEGVRYFTLMNEVWVCELSYALPLVMLVRDKLIALSHLRESEQWRETKMEMLYAYLTSNDFRAKMENIIEAFTSLRNDLESEKRAMERIWSKREKELSRAISSTAMLYGDMQGIIGKSLPSVDYFELPAGEE